MRAEIEAEAEERRRRDPEIAKLERNIERAWADIAPPGAAGRQNEQLLNRADRLSVLDADASTGSRRIVRPVKAAIRKATYWYLRHITDQFNAFARVLIRLLRHLDQRVGELEAAIRLSDDDAALLDPPPEPSLATAAAVASLATGRCLVLSCGEGTLVEAIQQQTDVYGVEHDPCRIVAGAQRGLDLRASDIIEHLRQVPDSTLATIVLSGAVETLPMPTLWRLIGESGRVLDDSGRVVVAVSDPALRDGVEAEIRAERGIAPATWRHLLGRAGFAARLVPAPGPRIVELVVADRL